MSGVKRKHASAAGSKSKKAAAAAAADGDDGDDVGLAVVDAVTAAGDAETGTETTEDGERVQSKTVSAVDEEGTGLRRTKSSRRSRMDADAASEATAAAARDADPDSTYVLSQDPASNRALAVPSAPRGRSKSPAPAAATAGSRQAPPSPKPTEQVSAAPAAAAAAAATGTTAPTFTKGPLAGMGQFNKPAAAAATPSQFASTARAPNQFRSAGQFSARPAAAAASASGSRVEMGLIHIGGVPDMKLMKVDTAMKELNTSLVPLDDEKAASSWYEFMDPKVFTAWKLGWRKTKNATKETNNFVVMDTRQRIAGSFANVKLEMPHAMMHIFAAPPYGNWIGGGEELKTDFPSKDVYGAKWSCGLSMRAYGDNSDENGCDPAMVKLAECYNKWNDVYLRAAIVEDPEVKQWWVAYQKPLLAGAKGKKWEDLCKADPEFEEGHIQNFIQNGCHWEFRKKNDDNPKLKDPFITGQPTNPWFSVTLSGWVCQPEDFGNKNAAKIEAAREAEWLRVDTPENRRKLMGLATRRMFENKINGARDELNKEIEKQNKNQPDRSKHQKLKPIIRMTYPRFCTFDENGVKRELEYHEFIGISKKNDFVASCVVKLCPRKPSTPGAQGVVMLPGLELELVEAVISRSGLTLKRQETAARRAPIGSLPFVPAWADGGMSPEALKEMLERVAPDKMLRGPDAAQSS